MSDDGWRTDTAERPAVRIPTTPTTPTTAPPPAAQPGASAPLPPAGHDRPVDPPAREPAPAWVAWLVVAAVLLVTAFAGAYLIVRDPGDSTATDPTPSASDPSAEPSAEAPPAEAEETDEEATEEEPVDEEPAEEQPEEPVGDPVDVTASTTVTVPGAAPANNDVTGELVTFVGDNLLDDDAATCWRVAGDATGSSITFTFAEPITLTEVGLINGYAKTSVDDAGQSFDWYHGNRRVLSAQWVVEGQTYGQDLGDTTELQTVAIDPVATTTVELRLTQVSPPGVGPTGRDYTAISDVRLVGSQ